MIPWEHEHWHACKGEIVNSAGESLAQVHSEDPRVSRLIEEAPEMLRLLKSEVVQAELMKAGEGWDFEVNALITRVEGKKE